MMNKLTTRFKLESEPVDPDEDYFIIILASLYDQQKPTWLPSPIVPLKYFVSSGCYQISDLQSRKGHQKLKGVVD